VPEPSSYSDEFLRKRVSSGPDKGRATYANGLADRARAGDQAAIAELAWRSGIAPDPNPNDHEGAWATADAKNYGQMLLRDVAPGYNPQYQPAHDGGGLLSGIGHTLGSVLKIGAPIAGALIPGVGTLGAGLIGGLGNSAGQLMSGGHFNPLQALGAGAGAAAGNRLLGNGLGSGSSNWGFGSSQGIPGMPGGAPGGAPGGQGGAMGPGGVMAPGGGVAGAVGQGQGLLDRFGGIGSLLQKYGPLALGAAGAFNQASQTSGADHLREAATQGALQDWQSRAPARARATSMLSDGSLTDQTDPYRRPVPAMGQLGRAA
jgi:hypothetical protein